jgi:uncharacterized membrane protein
MLKQRVITSLVGIPVVIVVFWFGDPWFTLLIAVWSALGVPMRLVILARANELARIDLPWYWCVRQKSNPLLL